MNTIAPMICHREETKHLKNQSITSNILIQDLHQVEGKDTQRFMIFVAQINVKTIAPNAMIRHREEKKNYVSHDQKELLSQKILQLRIYQKTAL